jgi:hypothetical protein
MVTTTANVDERQKAAEILRNLKRDWGVTWQQMSKLLGGTPPPKSLSVFVSKDNWYLMPSTVANLILDLQHIDPPKVDLPNATVAIVLSRGIWRVMPCPDIRECKFCGKPFVPAHPQQAYCDGYRGDCGKAMRRKRRRDATGEYRHQKCVEVG